MTPRENYPSRLLCCASLATIYLGRNPRDVAQPLTAAGLILAEIDWMKGGEELAPITRATSVVERVLRDCRVEYHAQNRAGLEVALRQLQTACFALADRWTEVFSPRHQLAAQARAA
ncbi:hypothetical protein [Roseomonas xinghualingensis]|uniref:hypothetical protein n=1 Tax=Roseomonas xinghualingensis TaxID=2986475 RepID=UPI0021F0FC83|nr:hypothetical protein [Roseomonas sp. SXEYE001]MCV4206887.1 hypothetical protein [Roseomonas sp. SXEYE001]